MYLSFLYNLRFKPMIFYNNNFGFHLDFCGIPLVFNMDMNRFMIIGIKEKTDPEYKQDCRHIN